MEKKTNIFSRFLFQIIKGLVWLFYPKIKIIGERNIPNGSCIIVGNHSQMNGPICSELYLPGNPKIWCAWQMMVLNQVPEYTYNDFWSNKPKAVRWFYKLLSYIIAPISVCVFNNARTIAVYHDNRMITTFRQTNSALDQNLGIVIFPECRKPYNHVVNQFQERFVDVAKLYFKRTGKALEFVPMYIAPKLKTIYFGKSITFNPDTPIDEERTRICNYLMQTITDIAVNLPEHIVVPYDNIPKKKYRTNIS